MRKGEKPLKKEGMVVVSDAQRNSNKMTTEKRRLNLTVRPKWFLWSVGDGLSINWEVRQR